MLKFIYVLVLAMLLQGTFAHAARSCKTSAKHAVEMLDPMNPLKVDKVSVMTDEDRPIVINIIEQRGPRASRLTPMQHQLLLNDLKDDNKDFNYYLVDVAEALFLVLTDADSCSPSTPVQLL